MSARLSNKSVIFLFSFFLIVIGLFYSGGNFLTHISDGIPANPVSGGVVNMVPGDHHEQFYRYSIVYENLLRGRFPYYAGYQFSSTEYQEGLVYFPFSLLVGLMSFIFGPILSYNLLLLFSYVFVGVAGYLMVKQLTKSTVAALLSGVFLATVPFRTSFLYGQMVYGIDAVLIPLLIYSIERAKKTRQGKFFATTGLIYFLMLTSNFQMFYWATLLLFPYMLYALVKYINYSKNDGANWIKPLYWLLPGIVCCVGYSFFIYGLMKSSALSSGQNFDEVIYYSPQFINLFSKFSGNEKNVYFGLTALLVAPWIISPIFYYRGLSKRTVYIPLFLVSLLASLLLIFGPTIDKALNIYIYRWFFDHIPGANGTRTTGRIMSVAVVFYAILLGYFIRDTYYYLHKNFKKIIPNIAIGIIGIFIIFDFNYLNPNINKFELDNKAYSKINGKEYKVITLPFQYNSAHYYNSTFLMYALKYDFRLFSGHSSFYPKIIDNQVDMLYGINSGIIDYDQWRWLVENNFDYLIAHATTFQPNIPLGAVASLTTSNFLKLESFDNGVYIFKIVRNPAEPIQKFASSLDFNKWVFAIKNLQVDGKKSEPIDYAFGWYTYEVYPNQKPFRWMKKLQSMVIINGNDIRGKVLEFDYSCPGNKPLKVEVYGNNATTNQELMSDGWTRATVKFSDLSKGSQYIQLQASAIYEAPPDIRKFGCQISDMKIK